MRYKLKKPGVFSFVALKIIVFSALIFVITGCQMSEEEINTLVDRRVAEKTLQIENALADQRTDIQSLVEWDEHLSNSDYSEETPLTL